MAEQLIVDLLDQDGRVIVHDQVFDFGTIVEILVEAGKRVIIRGGANTKERLELCVPHDTGVDVGLLRDGPFRLHDANVGPDVGPLPEGFFKSWSRLSSQR